MKPAVGFIGLGLMGAPMAARLLDAGYPLRVYNRTRPKADALLARGALWCGSPAEVASGASVVFTMVTDDHALAGVTLGDKGVTAALQENGIHVDCSTVSPDITASLERHYAFTGRTFFHVPVLGGKAQAADGSLLLFVGGDPDRRERIAEFLPVLGKRTWTFPAARQATFAKLACNSFIAGLTVTLAQGLMFAAKSGVGAATLLEILEQSSLNSSSLQRKGHAMVEHDFTPSFFAENLLKDTALMIEAAQSMGIPAPVAEAAHKLLQQTVHEGFSKEDYSAVITVWEHAAGFTIR